MTLVLSLATVCFIATYYLTLGTTPHCILMHRGLATGVVPLEAAVAFLILFGVFTRRLRRRKEEATLAKRMKDHLFVALSLVMVILLLHFFFCGPVMHLGKHTCKLGAWSP